MPLFHGKSKKDFEHNIKAEMHAGKPQPQALAIAYSVKRRGKKMADGGKIPHYDEGGTIGNQISKYKTVNAQESGAGAPQPSPKPMGAGVSVREDTSDPDHDAAVARYKAAHNLAEGGKVGMASSEMKAGMPGKPIALPDEQDLLAQEQRSSEMGRRSAHERIMMARHQAEMEKHGMSDSEMDHLAEGGYIEGAMKHHDAYDSEMHAGMPGMHIAMPDEEDEEGHEMSSSEMGRGMAHGGLAGNPKLQQAYSKGEPKSIAESIMRKKMANGGQVDIELNAMEEGEDSLGSSPLDNMDRHAASKENYDEGMHSEFGDEGDDLQHGEGISERIRRKRMK